MSLEDCKTIISQSKKYNFYLVLVENKGKNAKFMTKTISFMFLIIKNNKKRWFNEIIIIFGICFMKIKTEK